MTRAIFSVLALFGMLGLAGTAIAFELETVDGKPIPKDATFTRIVSLYSAHTENIEALGAGDRLVAVSKSDKESLLPKLSAKDGVERFLALSPDLVLVRPMLARGNARLMAALSRMGIAVISLQPQTVDEMLAYWKTLGRLTETDAAAERLVEGFTSEVDRIRKITADIRPKTRVFFEARHEKLRTISPGSMPAFVLEVAGGINVATDAIPSRGTNIARYGKERLLGKASEIELYLAQQGRMNRVSREIIEDEPGFSLIPAVREGNIHFVAEHRVSRPTPELLSGIRDVITILYPDTAMALFGDADSMQKAAY